MHSLFDYGFHNVGILIAGFNLGLRLIIQFYQYHSLLILKKYLYYTFIILITLEPIKQQHYQDTVSMRWR